MPPSTVVARRRANRRQEILDAAWRLAAEQGVASLSVRDLAAAVGMKAPSLYEYFDGKGAIYDAMFAQGWAALDEAMPGEVVSDPQQALARFIEAFLDFCSASLPRYQLLFTRVIPSWEPSPEAYQAAIDSYAAMSAQLATVGATDPADVDLFTSLTAGLAAQQAANDPTGDRYRGLAPAVARMFLFHLTEGPTP